MSVPDLDEAGASRLGDELEEGDMEGHKAQAQLAGLEALLQQLLIRRWLAVRGLAQALLQRWVVLADPQNLPV